MRDETNKDTSKDFEAILNAVEAKKTSLLPEGVAIDLCRPEFPQTVGGVLAHQNDREGVIFLLEQCAAYPNYPAMCAASNGHEKLAEELLTVYSASMHSVAYGAGRYGNKEWALKLMKQGACITSVAQGAAFSGRQDWVAELITQGADAEALIFNIMDGGHLANDALALRWLSQHSTQESLDNWLGLFRMHNKGFSETLLDQVRQHHVLMSAPKEELKFSYSEACLLTDQAHQYTGGLYILRILYEPKGILFNDTSQNSPEKSLPAELWFSILSITFNVDEVLLEKFNKKVRHAHNKKLLFPPLKESLPLRKKDQNSPKPEKNSKLSNYTQCSIL